MFVVKLVSGGLAKPNFNYFPNCDSLFDFSLKIYPERYFFIYKAERVITMACRSGHAGAFPVVEHLRNIHRLLESREKWFFSAKQPLEFVFSVSTLPKM
jgi:hypothetical protein